MSNRAYALLTGAFIIVLGLALAAAGIWLSGRTRAQGRPYIVVSKGSVSGLTAGSEVFLRGVAAGKVDSIVFSRKNPHNILIRIEVKKSIPLTQGAYATLQTRALTGSSQIQLATHGRSQAPLTTSQKRPTRIPMRPSLIQSLSTSGRSLMKKLSRVASSLSDLLNKQNKAHLQHVLAQTDEATAELVGIERQIKVGLRKGPNLRRDIHGTLKRIDRLVMNLNDVTSSLKRVANNASHFTHTGEQAGNKLMETTIPKINSALEQLIRTGANIQNLTQTLKDEPQSLLFGPRAAQPGPGEGTQNTTRGSGH
jgi:phospholipid/cholesterol/gamma-HCH transport system substrate-binding protein